MPFAQLMLLVTFDVALGCATLAAVVWLLARRRDWRAPSRRRPWGAALLGTAAALMVACLPAAWGRVDGEVLSTSFLSMDARPADTFVGLIACLVTASLFGAHAIVLLAGRDSRVFVVLSLLVASAWAGLVVDVILVASAVNEVAGIGSSASAEKASGEASVGLAAWMALAAAVLVAVAVIASRPAPLKRRGTRRTLTAQSQGLGSTQSAYLAASGTSTQPPALTAGQPPALGAGGWSIPAGELHSSTPADPVPGLVAGQAAGQVTGQVTGQFLDGEPERAHPNGEHR